QSESGDCSSPTRRRPSRCTRPSARTGRSGRPGTPRAPRDWLQWVGIPPGFVLAPRTGHTGYTGHRGNVASRSILHQVLVVTGFYQRLVGAPDLVWKVLGNLESAIRIEPDPLQVAHHDADDVVGRQRVVAVAIQVLIHRHAG